MAVVSVLAADDELAAVVARSAIGGSSTRCMDRTLRRRGRQLRRQHPEAIRVVPPTCRLALQPHDFEGTVLSRQYLSHDASPDRESELSPGVIECPLCHGATASEVLFGLPDPASG
jgi:hypothetical protein